MSTTFNCLWCGTPRKTNASQIKQGKQIFCCRECAAKSKKLRGTAICPNCGEEFEKTGMSPFCSTKCRKSIEWKEARTNETVDVVPCGNPDCNNTFVKRVKNQKYCCRKCSDHDKHLKNMEKKEQGSKSAPRKRKKRQAPIDPWNTFEIFTGTGSVANKPGQINYSSGAWL